MSGISLTILTNVIVGIAVGAASAWITALISLQKYRRERWWERKVLAYERIIDSLYKSKTFSDKYMSIELSSRDMSDEEEKDIRENAKKSHEEILKSINIGSFLLPDEAVSILVKYKKDSKNIPRDIGWFGYLEEDNEITSKALENMIKCAKKDLRV